MPYGTPRTQAQRIERHQSIYGNTSIPNPRTQQIPCCTTSVGLSEENETLIMVVLGIGAIYTFVEFVLPNIWKKP